MAARWLALVALLVAGLVLSGCSGSAQPAGQGSPNDGWFLALFALILLLVLLVWWLLGGPEKEAPQPAAHAAHDGHGHKTEAGCVEFAEAEHAHAEGQAAATEENVCYPVGDAGERSLVAAPAAAVPADAAPVEATPAAPAQPDDLKLIEGIGPKISGLLNARGHHHVRTVGDRRRGPPAADPGRCQPEPAGRPGHVARAGALGRGGRLGRAEGHGRLAKGRAAGLGRPATCAGEQAAAREVGTMSQDVNVITLPLPLRMGSVNCYLLRGQTGFVLIDTGPGNARGKLMGELERLGCAPGSLKLIVLTHGDLDHTGNAAFLRAAFGGKLAMHRDDAGMAEHGDMFFNRKRSNAILRALVPKVIRFGAAERFTPDLMLGEGDNLSAFGIDATVLSVPGHSLGSIAILTAAGDLFCGDLLENTKEPAPGSIIDDVAAARASVARIRGLMP